MNNETPLTLIWYHAKTRRKARLVQRYDSSNIREPQTHCHLHLEKLKLFDSEAPKNGRPLAIRKEDAITFALYQHRSTRCTKISVYRDYKSALGCSYNTFVVSMNRYALVALRILFWIMRMHHTDAHLLKLIDSTDIPVCLPRNAKNHRETEHGFRWH